MSRLSLIPENFEGKVRVNNWLEILNSMQASDELNDDQVRQFLFDLESAYAAFNNVLHST
jgi:ESCRT-I complex subunit VPS28